MMVKEKGMLTAKQASLVFVNERSKVCVPFHWLIVA
jgi:hypothetical protein